MNIFLTGGNGQVGYELKRSLAIFGTVDSPDRTLLNLENSNEVIAYLDAKKPDLIVNAAAWTAVDKAEEEKEKAEALNKNLPKILADYAAKEGIWLVHYSSDYVYPGIGIDPWTEENVTGPLSVYGESKLQGDMSIISSSCLHLIFRTSWVYSTRGKNFMKTMLKLAQTRELLTVVNDQYGAPTTARLIADITALAVNRICQAADLDSGIYHLASSETTNWYEFANSIFTIARANSVDLSIKEVIGIPTSAYPTPAKRPLNSRLAVDKIENAFGITMPDWHSQLVLTMEDYLCKKEGWV